MLAAGGVERLLRLLTTWYLSRAMGAAGFGAWSSAVTLLTVAGALAPLGSDVAIVYFGARHRREGELGRLKGALQVGLAVALGSGAAVTLAFAALSRWGPLPSSKPDLAGLVAPFAPVLLAWALLLFAVGVLRSAKAMAAQALSYQVALPALVLVGTLLAVDAGLGVEGALAAWVGAAVAASLLAATQAWRRVSGLLLDPSLPSHRDPRAFLAFSLPQCLESLLFRLTQWTDVLLLTWLATSTDVGLYRVAASLALLVQLPVAALATAWNPVAAELVAGGDRERLQETLQTVTRWLVVLAAPLLLGVALVPDLVLLPFGPEYGASLPALGWLVAGQAVYVAAVPVMRLLPMSGRAGLNLALHAAVFLLNAGLGAWWVPRHGFPGAAAATAAALGAWALGSAVLVRVQLGCNPLSSRLLLLAAVQVSLYAVAAALTGGAPLPLRGAGVGLALLASAAVGWRWGTHPADRALLGDALAHLRARLTVGRRRR